MTGEADEKAMEEWATQHKISPDCVKLLVKDGFTSMEALHLLEQEDINPKIPRGQQRLIMQAVRQFKTPEAEKQQEDCQHRRQQRSFNISGPVHFSSTGRPSGSSGEYR